MRSLERPRVVTTFAVVFVALLLFLGIFAVRSVQGTGHWEDLPITAYQMLLLALIVTPYALVVILMGDDEHAHA